MPELAEVEFYRRKWNCGLKEKVLGVDMHASKRIFRGTDTRALETELTKATLTTSESGGKQLLFNFGPLNWLGLHLGMTGHLRVEAPDYTPLKHDHLVLRQRKQSLVFTDARQFGRVLFHHGKDMPDWWAKIPAPVTSRSFTGQHLANILQRHRKLPVKAALLLQDAFPGIGNWMADEILWRARIHPRTAGGKVIGPDLKELWTSIRFVAKQALKHISSHKGDTFGDPPKEWLFHERWKRKGLCPRDGTQLNRATVGGRTTVWCEQCQKP